MTTNQYDEIATCVQDVQSRVNQAAQRVRRDPAEIQVMGVTKTVPADRVNAAIEAGVSLLGENRAQELLEKCQIYSLPKEQIHFIGHLQKNKVKSIIDKIGMIESVDSIPLADEIEKQAKKFGLIMPVLAQVNIGEEPTKSGFLKSEIDQVIERLCSYEHIRLQGLMCIPPKGSGSYYFQKMHQIYIDKKGRISDNNIMQFLSMGMSGDFETAIKYGSNIVRIGSAMFGDRKQVKNRRIP